MGWIGWLCPTDDGYERVKAEVAAQPYKGVFDRCRSQWRIVRASVQMPIIHPGDELRYYVGWQPDSPWFDSEAELRAWWDENRPSKRRDVKL